MKIATDVSISLLKSIFFMRELFLILLLALFFLFAGALTDEAFFADVFFDDTLFIGYFLAGALFIGVFELFFLRGM